MAIIELTNIEKSFGSNKVINNFNIKIKDGEFIVLVGPSGCGKSTLLRMISGLEKVDNGEIFLDKKLINNLLPSRREIAMVFQSYALYPHMNVHENMSFGLKMEKLSKSEMNKKVNEAAKTLQIGDLLNRKPRELSGGQRQRVGIARALMQEPEMLLVDEPTSSLDPKIAVEMMELIKKIADELRIPVLCNIHNIELAKQFANKILGLQDGKKKFDGVTEKLTHDVLQDLYKFEVL